MKIKGTVSPSLWLYLLHREARIARQRLREWVRQLSGKESPRPYEEGTPAGLSNTALARFCLQKFGEELVHVRHVHLSGWKQTGAYRLDMWYRSGSQSQIIFKSAVYDEEQIPALRGLPSRPGKPEYHLYRQVIRQPVEFLPTVYLAEEVEPGRHYQYLMEDIAPAYHHNKHPLRLVRFAASLPRFHAALHPFQASIAQADLIQYDHAFSLALQDYTLANLGSYFASQPDEDGTWQNFQNMWPQVAELHSDLRVHQLIPPVLIHGDLNWANVFTHNIDRDRYKVIDAEWAGIGLPHADLVSLLNAAAPIIEERALRAYMDAQPDLSPANHQRLYYWSKLQRALLDAGFLAAQWQGKQNESRWDMQRVIRLALQKIDDACSRLRELGKV